MLYIAVFVRLSPLSFWLESVGNTIKSRESAGDTVDGVQFVAPPLTWATPLDLLLVRPQCLVAGLLIQRMT